MSLLEATFQVLEAVLGENPEEDLRLPFGEQPTRKYVFRSMFH